MNKNSNVSFVIRYIFNISNDLDEYQISVLNELIYKSYIVNTLIISFLVPTIIAQLFLDDINVIFLKVVLGLFIIIFFADIFLIKREIKKYELDIVETTSENYESVVKEMRRRNKKGTYITAICFLIGYWYVKILLNDLDLIDFMGSVVGTAIGMLIAYESKSSLDEGKIKIIE